MQVGLIGYFLWVENGWNFSKSGRSRCSSFSIMVEQMQTPGDLRYVDVNGDKISFDDRTDIGIQS
jgi:hypothetical protein